MRHAVKNLHFTMQNIMQKYQILMENQKENENFVVKPLFLINLTVTGGT